MRGESAKNKRARLCTRVLLQNCSDWCEQLTSPIFAAAYDSDGAIKRATKRQDKQTLCEA